MKRKNYSEEQIISILKEHEAGALGPDLARRHSVAENTVYRWKSKYGGMEISVTVPLEQSHLDYGSFAVMPLAWHRQPEAVCQGIDAV